MKWMRPAQVGAIALALVASAAAQEPLERRGSREMVASAHPIASGVGAEVLAGGGNAADAAVAVAFALAVVLPAAGNVGGGGFLLHAPGEGGAVRALDFRETAPGRAHADMYLDAEGEVVPERSRSGWLAVGVPGTVRGMAVFHAEHGSRPWSELLAPAIRLAREGFVLDEAVAGALARDAARLRACPAARAVFLDERGEPLASGDRLVQTDLAWTLGRIAEHGARDFYEGEVARRLVAAMAERGGLVDAADLAGYRAVWREPIEVSFRGHAVHSMPPPSSGGICLAMLLGGSERLGLAGRAAGSASLVHGMVELEKRVYADRSVHLGDPDFHPVPVEWLLSSARLDAIARSIDPERATPGREVRPGEAPDRESEETTHFSVVDAEGNAVSCTYTLNASHGAAVMAPGTGFLLNDEMDDFSAKPGTPNLYGLVGGEANAIAPGKRMLSSMSPTIVRREGKNVLVLGTPGGSTIITTVYQVLLHRLGDGASLAEAIARPRFHHQWTPDRIQIEAGRSYDERALEALRRLGHEVVPRSPIGDVQAIEIDPATGTRIGVSDPRGHGRPAGR